MTNPAQPPPCVLHEDEHLLAVTLFVSPGVSQQVVETIPNDTALVGVVLSVGL